MIEVVVVSVPLLSYIFQLAQSRALGRHLALGYRVAYFTNMFLVDHGADLVRADADAPALVAHRVVDALVARVADGFHGVAAEPADLP